MDEMPMVAEHYEGFLARIYAWSLGGVDAALNRATRELAELDLSVTSDSRFLDLGAGFGPHALSLARQGASVVAVDSSRQLLDELESHRGGASIRTVHAELLDYIEQESISYDSILCMGDTITHLDSEQDVLRLLAAAVNRLTPNGVFVLSFRDYSIVEPGCRQFFLVRADDDRIMTCALEHDLKGVRVHDLLHERREGRWALTTSSYRKQHIAPARVVAELEQLGCKVNRSMTETRMVIVTAVA